MNKHINEKKHKKIRGSFWTHGQMTEFELKYIEAKSRYITNNAGNE